MIANRIDTKLCWSMLFSSNASRSNDSRPDALSQVTYLDQDTISEPAIATEANDSVANLEVPHFRPHSRDSSCYLSSRSEWQRRSSLIQALHL